MGEASPQGEVGSSSAKEYFQVADVDSFIMELLRPVYISPCHRVLSGVFVGLAERILHHST